MPFCTVHFRTYPAEHSGCITCYQEQAHITRYKTLKEAKHTNTLAKQKERFKGSTVPIKQVSKKQASINAQLAKIKKELLAENPVCFSSGETSNLTLSHIISRKHTEYATDKRNLVLEEFHTHEIYEHNKRLYAELYPKAWQLKLERAKEMNQEHFYKLLNKITDE